MGLIADLGRGPVGLDTPVFIYFIEEHPRFLPVVAPVFSAVASSRLPAITLLSIKGHVNGGIRGVLRAEARDDEAASNLRDVVRGFMALAKLGAGSKPELQLMMQSLELGGTGKTVALSFTVPAEVFDAVGAIGNGFGKKNLPAQK